MVARTVGARQIPATDVALDSLLDAGRCAPREFQLLPSAFLVSGVSVERYSTVGTATTPHIGPIVTHNPQKTVKLLYGEAFRAPGAAEALLSAGACEPKLMAHPDNVQDSIVADARIFALRMEWHF
jgi:hypothetical protein